MREVQNAIHQNCTGSEYTLSSAFNTLLVAGIQPLKRPALVTPEDLQRGHKVGEKNAKFSRLFHRLLQQKIPVNVIMTFIKGHDDPVYPVNSCFTQIFD